MTEKKSRKKIPSRAKAINDKCKDCIYDSLSPGTWRKQVEDCTASPESKHPCPLWELRPTSSYSSEENEEEIVA